MPTNVVTAGRRSKGTVCLGRCDVDLTEVVSITNLERSGNSRWEAHGVAEEAATTDAKCLRGWVVVARTTFHHFSVRPHLAGAERRTVAGIRD